LVQDADITWTKKTEMSVKIKRKQRKFFKEPIPGELIAGNMIEVTFKHYGLFIRTQLKNDSRRFFCVWADNRFFLANV